MRLYELTSAVNAIWEMVMDDEMDLDTLEDTLQSLEEAIEQKAEGLAHVIKQAEFEADFVRNEEKRLAEKRRVMEAKAERLKVYLQESLEAAGKPKLKTERYSFSVQNNPPSVMIDDESKIPEQFLIPQAPNLDKKSLLQALKDGELIPGCEIVQKRGLRIR